MTMNDARAHEDEVLHALLARLLAAALGDDTNLGAYHALVERYPATVILCAFETASGLPPTLIRKSRGAYFTFLLQRLAPSNGSSNPSVDKSATWRP